MQLTTARFLLRDFVDADLPAFAAYHADPRSQALYGPGEAGTDLAPRLLALFKAWALERPRRNYQFAIVRDGVLIGCCGLRGKDADPGRAELGVELAPGYWGRHGYALEVMRRLADFGFGELALDEIHGSTVSANHRIARLAAAFGAVAQPRPAPGWMLARGWHPVEWRIGRAQWLASASGRAPRPRAARASA